MKYKLLTRPIICLMISFMVFMTGCNKIENLSNSGTRLIVDVITGNDITGQPGSIILYSDVVDMVNGVPVIYDDPAQVFLRGELIKIGGPQPTPYQDIIVDQIDISYSRSDKTKPVEGKDVPYGYSQKVNFLVTIGDSIEYGFVIVPHVAKIESPLVELVGGGSGKVLRLEANLTFYGKDLAGNRVAPVKTSVSIWCADFADED